MSAAQDEDEIVELAPDYKLKEKIGKDVKLSEVFSADIIKNSQEVINKSQKDFLKWVENDLTTMENAYKSARSGSDDLDECVTVIKKTAFSVKAQAGTFGFDLGSAVAKSLYDYCENQFHSDPDQLIVLRKHMDTLRTIFHSGVVGDGGKVGAALHGALCDLVDKYT